ncbi:BspA family leucine-rich repeat surface protein [Chryseobacterium sp. C-71]|uniref:BspA family leucine-rich repeat surface protein n=1 Tax=Chryseobacterium sp. C-71 TaxID=2893882 RepID=UPI001E59F3F5|nr:BspA family leucine-rich repeat surface protein [Chryseobacterium sp. C-71]UFH31525.1 BspA family leucine-rich repeat surface protein [Chryseobacterium sp. C-71]
MRNLLLIAICVFFFQITKAQNEFITIWQPGIITTPVLNVNAPFQANSNQIWFPGTGQNYTISWEEIGFPQHNGTMTNVTSNGQVLIDFGTPSKEDGLNTTYRVKVSNGNGVFQQIKFASHQTFNPIIETQVPNLQMLGSADKLLIIEQWGNIAWTSMNAAFANCQRMVLTATDSPNLTNVTNASLMFYFANSFLGADSMQNWDTSTIENFSFMFAQHHIIPIYTPPTFSFNPTQLSSWDTSSATDLSYMFTGRNNFNQNLNSWDVSKVKNMSWMFAFCSAYNQPLDNWNTSSLQNIHNMFFSASLFNQPLNNWNTSNVTNMNRVFTFSTQFNQPLNSWNVSNVIKMSNLFDGASSFNQSLASWNLSSLTEANVLLRDTAIDCNNYSLTLTGWADNPNTPNNINLSTVAPAQYAANITSKRDILINKGWNIIGDTVGNCVLSTSEIKTLENPSIYPNPTSDYIYVKNLKNIKNYKILDSSGRLIMNETSKSEKINVRNLLEGNYILQINTDKNTLNFKFIKN